MKSKQPQWHRTGRKKRTTNRRGIREAGEEGGQPEPRKSPADRKANGGHLTQSEKAQVNKQQNKLSSQIYKDKHNSFRQKP
jgi:hypothetical protein